MYNFIHCIDTVAQLRSLSAYHTNFNKVHVNIKKKASVDQTEGYRLKILQTGHFM